MYFQNALAKSYLIRFSSIVSFLLLIWKLSFSLPKILYHLWSIDSLSGVLRIWSVSKETPVLNLKLKETGFHSLCVIPQQQCLQDFKSVGRDTTSAASSTSSSSGGFHATQNSIYQIPPAHVACTFLDGGIGLYDVGKRRWEFLRDYVCFLLTSISFPSIIFPIFDTY